MIICYWLQQYKKSRENKSDNNHIWCTIYGLCLFMILISFLTGLQIDLHKLSQFRTQVQSLPRFSVLVSHMLKLS